MIKPANSDQLLAFHKPSSVSFEQLQERAIEITQEIKSLVKQEINEIDSSLSKLKNNQPQASINTQSRKIEYSHNQEDKLQTNQIITTKLEQKKISLEESFKTYKTDITNLKDKQAKMKPKFILFLLVIIGWIELVLNHYKYKKYNNQIESKNLNLQALEKELECLDSELKKQFELIESTQLTHKFEVIDNANDHEQQLEFKKEQLKSEKNNLNLIETSLTKSTLEIKKLTNNRNIIEKFEELEYVRQQTRLLKNTKQQSSNIAPTSASHLFSANSSINSTVQIPNNLSGFLGKGVNPDQLLIDEGGNESSEVKDLKLKTWKLYDQLKQKVASDGGRSKLSHLELPFYNSMHDEIETQLRQNTIEKTFNNIGVTKYDQYIEMINNDKSPHDVFNSIKEDAMKQAGAQSQLFWTLSPASTIDLDVQKCVLTMIYSIMKESNKISEEWTNYVVQYGHHMMENKRELIEFLLDHFGLPPAYINFIAYDKDSQHFYLPFGEPKETSGQQHECLFRVFVSLMLLNKDSKTAEILNALATEKTLKLEDINYMKEKYKEKNNIPQPIKQEYDKIKDIKSCFINVRQCLKNLTVIKIYDNEINANFYIKLLVNILIALKDNSSTKYSIIQQLSMSIYYLHSIGDYERDKKNNLKSGYNQIDKYVNKLKNICNNEAANTALNEILKTAEQVKNQKINN